jgi:hypothetical protein
MPAKQMNRANCNNSQCSLLCYLNPASAGFFLPKILKTKNQKPKVKIKVKNIPASRELVGTQRWCFWVIINHVVLRILYDLKAKSRGAKDFERDIVSLRVML